MGAACTAETSVSTSNTTLCQNCKTTGITSLINDLPIVIKQYMGFLFFILSPCMLLRSVLLPTYALV